MSVRWESEGRQNWHKILQSHVWGQTGIAARVPEIGVYSWLGLQKELPHSRHDLEEHVKNLRKRPACFTQVSEWCLSHESREPAPCKFSQ